MRRRRLALPLIFIVVAALGGLAAAFLTDSSPELGLDLQGGVSVTLEPTGDNVDSGDLDVAVDIIRSRVDALGVAEPEIVREGDAITVQLPGVENRDRVLDLVGQTAELRFRPVLNQAETGGEGEECEARDEADREAEEAAAEGDGSTTTTTAPAETTTTTAAPAAFAGEGAQGAPSDGPQLLQSQDDTTTTTAPAETTTTTAPAGETTTTTAPAEQEIPLTPRADDAAEAEVILPDRNCEVIYQLGPTLATGGIVSSARAEVNDQTGAWEVNLTMKGGADGIDQFNEIAALCFSGAAECPMGQLAIVLDSEVVSAPQIQTDRFERDGIIISNDAGMPEGEAKDLALVLRYGSLPVELARSNVETVSATLGEDSLRAGIVAGLVGLVLVAGYMVLYYRALGLVVILGMGVWGSLLYSVISWLGATQGLALTLSGVTGIIVSVGVTVDSYVVYFERLKDEIRSGRTLRSSTERAFKRAFRTILAADISSFLGAAVLYQLTSGSVKGFAFFLGLSTILDVVVAWFYTRPMVILLSRNRVFTEARFLGVARGLAAPPSKAAAPAGGGR
jgi:preprotein translocase subunit SecD